MRLFLCIFVLVLVVPLQVSAQVAELARKFSLPDSLLPSDEGWKRFLKNNMVSDDKLIVANHDSSRVYAVIVQRDNKPARKFAEDVFMAKGMHDIKQQLGRADTVAFFAFPWLSINENGRTYRASPAFSTGLFKAPDLKTALQYFAFLDLVTRRYFAKADELWKSYDFAGKSKGNDLALEGKAPIITTSYLRDWYKSQKSAIELVREVMPQIKRIDANTYATIDARTAVHVINNDDFSKSLIPFSYNDSKGEGFIGILVLIETKRKKSIYLWNNKTPIRHVGRADDLLLSHLSSFTTSQWSPTDPPYRRKYIFNSDFWANEVEAKLDDGNFKYLTLIGDY